MEITKLIKIPMQIPTYEVNTKNFNELVELTVSYLYSPSKLDRGAEWWHGSAD